MFEKREWNTEILSYGKWVGIQRALLASETVAWISASAVSIAPANKIINQRGAPLISETWTPDLSVQSSPTPFYLSSLYPSETKLNLWSGTPSWKPPRVKLDFYCWVAVARERYCSLNQRDLVTVVWGYWRKALPTLKKIATATARLVAEYKFFCFSN